MSVFVGSWGFLRDRAPRFRKAVDVLRKLRHYRKLRVQLRAELAELVDALDSGSSGSLSCASSSLAFRIIERNTKESPAVVG